MSMPVLTHGYGVVVASAFPVEEVSGSLNTLNIKDVKILPTATLFGAGHIRVRVGTVITSHFRIGFRSQLDWLFLDVSAERSPQGDLALSLGRRQRPQCHDLTHEYCIEGCSGPYGR